MKGGDNVSNHNPKISIIMPVYNRQETIKNSIFCILNQSYTNFELIIVDDASTDNTSAIILSFEDERIKHIVLNKNVGAAAARNIGIRQSKGDWISFQDSDDYWEPDKLRKQVELINDRSPSIIFSSFIRYKYGSEEYIPRGRKYVNLPKEGNLHNQLLLGNFIATPTVLIPKTFLEKVGGFNEQMPRFQDWELWLRLSAYYPFIWIDEPLVRVHYTENSISSDMSKMIRGYELIWNLHKKMFVDAGPEYAAQFLFSYGHNLSLAGDTRKGRRMLFQSMKYYLFSSKQVICLGLSFCSPMLYRIMYKLYSGQGYSM